MDNTGSTSFILFDRNVSNYVGKSVQDLIDSQGQVIDLISGTKKHHFDVWDMIFRLMNIIWFS